MSLMNCCRQLRTKENEKNLAAQRLNFLKEKEASLEEFLQKSEGQLKGLEESILFTQQQVTEEEVKAGRACSSNWMN